MGVGLFLLFLITRINSCPGVGWQKRRDQDLRGKSFRDMEMCLALNGAGGFFYTSPAPFLHFLVALLFSFAGRGLPPLLSQAGYPSALVRPEKKRFLYSREFHKSRQKVLQGEGERRC